MISQSGFTATDEMARYFSKTTQTIRRDFKELESYGLVRQIHGGARSPDSETGPQQNLPYSQRQATQAMEKQSIGSTTANLIPSEKSIFLSLGTSTEAVARNMINHENMQFVTNNLNIAFLLLNNLTSEIQLCGGTIRPEDGGMLDPRAIDLISNIRIDYSVIGIGAISDDGDLYCYSIDEVKMAKIIINQSNVTILVADEQKFGMKATHRMGNLEDIDMFVTDKAPNVEMREICKAKQVKLIEAKE